MISFNDFQNIELRTARVLSAERIEGSEKLLRLTIDAGEEEPRPLVAGIARTYAPEDLVGKDIAIVANLEPKTIFGNESRGMLLAARDEDGNPILLMPERPTPPGSVVS